MPPANIAEEYRKTKRDLLRLRSALPRLMKPSKLLDRIVSKTRDVMLECSILDRLRANVPYFTNCSERFGEMERDIQILETKAENCEIRFLYLRHCLRTLHATAPLLIATGRTSDAAWTAMLEQKQKYCDAEGKAHSMVIHQDVVENILADQLSSITEFFATLRSLRAEVLKQQQDFQVSCQQKLEDSINTMQNSIQELAERIDSLWQTQRRKTSSRAAEVDEHPRRNDDNDEPGQDEIFMDTDEFDEKNREEMDIVRRTMEAKIHALGIRIQSLMKTQPCQPRQYSKGMRPDHPSESNMRCIFCGARGDHYSDSCGKVRDSKRRRILLKRYRRCVNCLEIGCLEEETCPKFWTKCHHCGRRDHHSALCEKPDIARQIEEEIASINAELTRTLEKLNSIRSTLGMDPVSLPATP
uniref:CCHC-type domain-containing protein n=1 Tax=Haemonchus contortus TaxID=6289 RepID=A0A7I4Y7N8_HAECO|nr:unnamed protein product [Haemonchus contortus]